MFFFNDTATTEIYTLSLHDALPIYRLTRDETRGVRPVPPGGARCGRRVDDDGCDVQDGKSTRLNSSHANISYAVFCLQKKITLTTSASEVASDCASNLTLAEASLPL